MFEWSDLRHFLAVARSGSTLSAAKILGVNQTTVARRVAALEEAIGEKLFDKTAGGYRLTEVGSAMVQNAERVEAEAEAFARMVAQRSRKLLGMIRVTTNDVLADCLLTPWLREFTQRFPVVQVETIITDRRLDISRGEADIALRANTSKGPALGDGVTVRRLATGKWGVYASKKYAAEQGSPSNAQELAKHPIIAGAGELARFDPAFCRRPRRRARSSGRPRLPSSTWPGPYAPVSAWAAFHACSANSIRSCSSASCSTRPTMTSR
ncbi:MAG: LysR family transcriptional regulator [Hyphomonadaceae bacterium]|nr:LysR family transcriptional regulator [Hyphomonadaceae bacterium]